MWTVGIYKKQRLFMTNLEMETGLGMVMIHRRLNGHYQDRSRGYITGNGEEWRVSRGLDNCMELERRELGDMGP